MQRKNLKCKNNNNCRKRRLGRNGLVTKRSWGTLPPVRRPGWSWSTRCPIPKTQNQNLLNRCRLTWTRCSRIVQCTWWWSSLHFFTGIRIGNAGRKHPWLKSFYSKALHSHINVFHGISFNTTGRCVISRELSYITLSHLHFPQRRPGRKRSQDSRGDQKVWFNWLWF